MKTRLAQVLSLVFLVGPVALGMTRLQQQLLFSDEIENEFGSVFQYLRFKVNSGDYVVQSTQQDNPNKPKLSSDQRIYNTIRYWTDTWKRNPEKITLSEQPAFFFKTELEESPLDWVTTLPFGELDDTTVTLALQFMELCKILDALEGDRKSFDSTDFHNLCEQLGEASSLLEGFVVLLDSQGESERATQKHAESTVRSKRMAVHLFDRAIRAYEQSDIFRRFRKELLFDKIGASGWREYLEHGETVGAPPKKGFDDMEASLELGVAQTGMHFSRRIPGNTLVFVSCIEMEQLPDSLFIDHVSTHIRYMENPHKLERKPKPGEYVPLDQHRDLRVPIESVSWNDIQRFLEIINKRLALNPLQIDGKTVTTKDGRRLFARARLPSAEEWTLAFKAGGDGELGSRKDAICWHKGNSGGETQPGGSKQPNAWGFFDMAGNVSEWTSTRQGSNYVILGGSYCSDAVGLDYRASAPPDARYPEVGFRLAFDLVEEVNP